MKTKYRAFGEVIQKVTVERETDRSLYLCEDKYGGRRRVSKNNAFYCCYYDSWKEAYLMLLKSAAIEVEIAEAKLIEKIERLNAIKALKRGQ